MHPLTKAQSVLPGNVLTVDQLLQLRNTGSLFSLRKKCNSNGSQKAALCSLLGALDGCCVLSMPVCDDFCSIMSDVQN